MLVATSAAPVYFQNYFLFYSRLLNISSNCLENSTPSHRSAADRPQDISFVLDQLLADKAGVDPAVIDASRIGMYGHSFGGYTTLAVAGGVASGTLPDPRIKAIAPLSPLASAPALPGPEFVPLIEDITVPTLVSYGTVDTIFGNDFFAEGRAIFEDLRTPQVGKKYRVEVQRGVHLGFSDFCAFTEGNLEVIQQGNANPWFDFANLAGLLTFDFQVPLLPPEFAGKSKDVATR